MNTITPIRFARDWCRGLFSLFYPRHCVNCLRTIEFDYLCNTCKESAEPIAHPFCETCSQPFNGAIEGEFTCSNCLGRKFKFDCAVARVRAQGVVRELIHRFKYGRELYLRHPLGDWLAAGLDDARILAEPFDAIIPVPLHRTRRRERGFNQALILARTLSAHCGVPVRNWLRRIRYTTTQTALNRRERMANLRNAFRLHRGAKVAGARLLLVDDVFTTGSTVAECSRVLRRAGAASIRVMVVARG